MKYRWKRIEETTPSGKQLYQCTGCALKDPAPTKNHDCVLILAQQVAAMKYKYERPGIKCHSGHENNLPLALWDCPMCTEAFRHGLRSAIRDCEVCDWSCAACGHDPDMTGTDLYSYLKEALEGRKWPLEAKGDVGLGDTDEAGGQGEREEAAEAPEKAEQGQV
jgi:hypothetical protein